MSAQTATFYAMDPATHTDCGAVCRGYVDARGILHITDIELLQVRHEMRFYPGDHVEFVSTISKRVYRGQVEGFIDHHQQMAMVTDQTGRGSRPVSTRRLKRTSATYSHSGRAA